MAFIRNVRSDNQIVTLFGNSVSLEYGETTQISATRLASTEVQTLISSGDLIEVPSRYYQDAVIKGDWDMAASTALPPGAQPGYVYSVVSSATHPSSGDSFQAGDLAIILSNGATVRNITSKPSSSGGGSSTDYTWVTVNSLYTPQDKEYLLADTSIGPFNILLPSSPALGFITAVLPNNGSFETNSVTVLRNTNLIQGVAEDLELNEDIPVSLIFVGGTVGWMVSPFSDSTVLIKDLQADSFYTLKPVAGTSYTPIAADSGKIIIFDTASPVSINLPSNATNPIQEGFNFTFRNKQGGAITLVPDGTDQVLGAGTVTTDSTKLNSFYLETSGTNSVWVSVGDYS